MSDKIFLSFERTFSRVARMRSFIGLVFVAFVFTTSGRSAGVKFVGLRELGKYSGVDHDGIAYAKTYYVSSYLKLSPPEARSFCKSFGPNVDLVSFEERNEFVVVRSKFEPEMRDKNILVVVGGFAHSVKGKTDFHWISSGLKTFPDQLEATNETMCLGIRKEKTGPVAFVPISCEEKLKFICQEIDLQYAN